jgi:hypothetical protein
MCATAGVSVKAGGANTSAGGTTSVGAVGHTHTQRQTHACALWSLCVATHRTLSCTHTHTHTHTHLCSSAVTTASNRSNGRGVKRPPTSPSSASSVAASGPCVARRRSMTSLPASKASASGAGVRAASAARAERTASSEEAAAWRAVGGVGVQGCQKGRGGKWRWRNTNSKGHGRQAGRHPRMRIAAHSLRRHQPPPELKPPVLLALCAAC